MQNTSSIALKAGDTPAISGTIEIGGKVFFTPDGLARKLGVTVRTLCRWDAARIGPPKAKIGKTILYNLDSIAAWLASRETEPVRMAGRRR